ncbi:hypothetical protein UFOVP787_135 [uncultured Caudovirales phage]|uniref:Uncharacterized protein n=1 Tax=uncultured Caudovirales phage TaxID=2100421 RepID=A0A6J5P0E8_9CAUD|nr:hypothetical protein UFOVP787_135 [uncultured Caudovirales phage]
MSHFLIRFNKSRGQTGRGTPDHVWRVFEGNKEYLFKHLQINAPIVDEQAHGEWNIACDGVLTIDRKTSTAIIDKME